MTLFGQPLKALLGERALDKYERNVAIALSICPGLEPSSLRKLVDVCGGAGTVWEADVSLWRQNCQIREDTLQQLDEWRRSFTPQRVDAYLAKRGIHCVVRGELHYPKALRDLHDPPLVLFTTREVTGQSFERTVSIVGTRRASGYALEATTWISESLAEQGHHVVSGLALGVDGAAHHAALKVGGMTTAVLGSGVDVCYPPYHRRLYDNMLKDGLLLSEYAPGTSVTKWRFPERNRIIAALSPTLIVVQAGDRSGALRTVDFALELGRDVYVVPGPITSIHFRGSNRLIQEGSQVLLDPMDLLQSLGGAFHPSVSSTVPDRWRELYEAIDDISVATMLASQLARPLSHVYAGLLELELAGLIVKRSGGVYAKAR